MKTKKRSKTGRKKTTAHRPVGMQKTREISRARLPKAEPDNSFTPMETGQPDADPVAGIGNPTGAQGGLGPLNQEGEGERQNDQLAALEITEPDEV
jgi:hypothetical protein